MTGNRAGEILSASILACAAIVAPGLQAQPAPVVVPAEYDPVLARGVVETNAGRVAVQFRIVRDNGYLYVSDDEGRRPGTQFIPIDSVDQALTLLADTRYAFLWPALTEWAGADLTKLRARQLEVAKTMAAMGLPGAPRDPAESSASRSLRPVLRYATVLAESGNLAGAKALLSPLLKEMDTGTSEGLANWSMVAVRIAAVDAAAGDYAGAIALLADAPMRPGESAFRINHDINRAAYLAESGSYAEALQVIEGARAAFMAAESDMDKGEKIRGSLRHFDWIRACALNGLGRTDEAQALMASVKKQGEPTDPDFVITSNLAIARRAYFCMGDADGLADTLLRDLASRRLFLDTLLLLQPGFDDPRRRATLAKLRADPRIQAAVSAQMRTLPDTMLPALNHWWAKPGG